MSILTLNSTFNDIKNLLKDKDICFKKTIEKTFEEVSKDEEQKMHSAFLWQWLWEEWELLMIIIML